MPAFNAPNHPVPVGSHVTVHLKNDPDPNNWIIKGKYEGVYGDNNELYTLSNYRMRGSSLYDLENYYDVPRSIYNLVLDTHPNNTSNLPPAATTPAPLTPNYASLPALPLAMNTAFELPQPAPLVPTPAYNPALYEALQPTSLMSVFNAANNLPAFPQPNLSHNSARRRRNTRRRSRARRISRARRHRRS
jgi:hypothetical protein